VSFVPSDAKALLADAVALLVAGFGDRGLSVTGAVSATNPRDVSLSIHLGRTDDPDDRARFVEAAPTLGLIESDYLAEFPWDGRRWQLVGLNPRSPRNCVEARSIPSGVSKRLPSEALWYVVQARSAG